MKSHLTYPVSPYTPTYMCNYIYIYTYVYTICIHCVGNVLRMHQSLQGRVGDVRKLHSSFLGLYSHLSMYIYIYICVCVCVCMHSIEYHVMYACMCVCVCVCVCVYRANRNVAICGGRFCSFGGDEEK